LAIAKSDSLQVASQVIRLYLVVTHDLADIRPHRVDVGVLITF
jgi:hypothetical protein